MLQAFTKRFCLLTVVMLLSVVNALAQDVIEIGTVQQLKDFRDAVNAGNTYAGKTVKLTADLDLQGEEWTPIFLDSDGTTIFDGDGHIISNLTISSQPALNKGVGLFSYLDGTTLKNLTLKNVHITANYKVGAFVGGEEGFAQIDNCHLDGATIITSVVDNDNAQHVGGIVGYLASSHTRSTNSSVTNCSVKNVTIQGYRDMGSIVGTLNTGTNVTPSEVSGCSAENVTLIQDNTTNYKNYAEPSQSACNIHEIVGRVIGSNTTEPNSYENVTFVMGKTASDVAQVGNVKYATLQAAVDAASANDVIELLQDIELTTVTSNPSDKYNVEINKSITIDGKRFKITSSQGKRALVLTGEGNIITLKNLTVINKDNVAALWISNALTCTLDNTVIDGTDYAGAYNQVVTISKFSDEGRVVLNVTNGSVIKTNDEGKAHYAIFTNHPTDINVTNSTIKGWAAVYVKSPAAGTNVTISNSTLVSSNAYSGVSNAFAAFVMEDNNVTVSVTNSKITLNNTGDQDQAIAAADGITGAVVNLGEGNEVTFVEPGNFKFALNDAEVKVSGGTYNADPSEYVAAGYEAVNNNNGTWTVSPAAVAQIGSNKYTTLAAAIAAANATGNVTINLLRDYDFEANEPGYGYTTSFLAEDDNAARNNMLEFSADDITFDLGGHTISNLFNNTFKVTGSNVTFQNGEMRVGQLYYSDLNGKAYTSENDKTCPYIVYVVDATNFTVNNLTAYGGINVSGSTATINGLSFSGTKFYAVCSQNNSTVTLNGGTYTKALTGAADYMFWVEAGSVMNIVGGTYTKGSSAFLLEQKPVITGGTFDFDPTNYGVADGYEAVANNNSTWTVGKVVTGELTPDPETEATETAATYTVEATVQDAEGKELASKTEQTVTVNIVTEADDDKKVASDATISKLNMETVVAKAITTDAAAAATAAAKDINVSIAVVSDQPVVEEQTQTYTYEVYPEATVTVTVDDTETSSTVKLANSDLKENASFTFTLDVTFAEGAIIQVVHKSADYPDEIFTKIVENGKVSITVSHFSSFELSEVAETVTASISAVGFATFSSTKAVDFTNIDAIHAYTAVVNGNKIEFTRIYQVPANTGLLLRNPNGGAVSANVPVITSANSVGINHLVAVSEDIPNGGLDIPEDGYTNFILNKVDNVVGFYRPNHYGVDAGRAYLKAPASEVSAVQSFTNLFDGETTAIDSITTADEQTQDNVFYDLSGRRVNNPQRGLYIVNGKKVLVK